MGDKQRIIDLQKQVRLARTALEKITHGCRDPEGVAEEALYQMMPLDRVQSSAGLLGWERRPKS